MRGRSSVEWWDLTKNNPDRLCRWLLSQYRGERLAAGRIEALRDKFLSKEQNPNNARAILTLIAEQERDHATWIRTLLTSRGIDVTAVPERAERYWPKAMASIRDLETGCAAAAHAEEMRLERIMAIIGDTDGPEDIREVFEWIFPQELFHARAFKELAGDLAMTETESNHKIARAALGLVP